MVICLLDTLLNSFFMLCYLQIYLICSQITNLHFNDHKNFFKGQFQHFFEQSFFKHLINNLKKNDSFFSIKRFDQLMCLAVFNVIWVASNNHTRQMYLWTAGVYILVKVLFYIGLNFLSQLCFKIFF